MAQIGCFGKKNIPFRGKYLEFSSSLFCFVDSSISHQPIFYIDIHYFKSSTTSDFALLASDLLPFLLSNLLILIE